MNDTAEPEVLAVYIQIHRILGRNPQEWLVHKGWEIEGLNSRRRLGHGSVTEDVTDDHLDHAQVAAASCIELASAQNHQLVELTVDFGGVEHLTDAARRHYLDRIKQAVKDQAPGLSLYLGWAKDDERLRDIEDRLRDVERSTRI